MWVVPFISTSLTYDLRQVYIYIYTFFFWKYDKYLYIYIHNIIFNSFSMNSSINMDTLCNLYMYYKCLSYIVPCKLNLFANAPIARHSAWRFDMIFSLSPWTPERFGVAERVPGCPSPPNRWSAGLLGSFHGVIQQFSAYLFHSQRSYGH